MVKMNETLKNNRIVRCVYYRLYSFLRKKLLTKKASEMTQKFNISFENEAQKNNLINDMVKMYAKYGFDFDEYLYYGFAEKSIKERLEFVADWEHLGYTCALNDTSNNALFDNKWQTYNKFGKYYGRELLFCNSSLSKNEFDAFVLNNKSFIAKPINASCGKGIQIINSQEYNCGDQSLFEALLEQYQGKFVVEQLIVQSETMKRLHPASVNTVRVPTIRLDDETIIVHPFLRVGQHSNFVDNAGAGGIMGAVDVATGKVFAAADEHGNVFKTHPDTNEEIVGFVIPRWEEAKALVKELATLVPENRYTGWDLALTDDGWVIVEANRRGQFVWQIPMQVGFRKEINEILKRLSKKY